jgi:hypothetical protein
MGVQTLSGAKVKLGAAGLGGGCFIRVKRLPLGRVAGEIDTGWDLPTNAVVQRVMLDITTAEATAGTKTVDVGLLSSESGGDADGFLVAASTAAAKNVQPTLVPTATLGALLKELSTGGAVHVPRWHSADSVTSKSVSYTLAGTHTELVGDIVILFIEM